MAGGTTDGAASAAPRPHHLRALDKANWLRSQRAQLKERLRGGDLELVERVIRGNDDTWEPIVRDMRLDAVLLAIRGVGPVTMAEVLEALGVRSPRVRWADLSFRRRGEVATALTAALAPDGDPVDTELE